VTLATNEWLAKESNTVLEKTCLMEKSPFFKNYMALKNNLPVEYGKECLKIRKLSFESNDSPSTVYMVVLPTEVILRGVTKK
jgi:hypothetical protein